MISEKKTNYIDAQTFCNKYIPYKLHTPWYRTSETIVCVIQWMCSKEKKPTHFQHLPTKQSIELGLEISVTRVPSMTIGRPWNPNVSKCCWNITHTLDRPKWNVWVGFKPPDKGWKWHPNVWFLAGRLFYDKNGNFYSGVYPYIDIHQNKEVCINFTCA